MTVKLPTFRQLLRKHGVSREILDNAVRNDISIYINGDIVFCRKGINFLTRYDFWDRSIGSVAVEKKMREQEIDVVKSYAWIAVLHYGRCGIFYDDKIMPTMSPDTVRRQLLYEFPYKVGQTLYTYGAGNMVIVGHEKGFIYTKYKFVESPLPYIVRYRLDWIDGKWSLFPFCHAQVTINPSAFDVTGVEK